MQRIAKGLKEVISLINRLLDRLAYWDWHKYWPLRDLLCKLGRHDLCHPGIEGEDIVLTCFYCGQRRRYIGAAVF